MTLQLPTQLWKFVVTGIALLSLCGCGPRENSLAADATTAEAEVGANSSSSAAAAREAAAGDSKNAAERSADNEAQTTTETEPAVVGDEDKPLDANTASGDTADGDTADDEPVDETALLVAAVEPRPPFPQRLDFPGFPKNLEWLNSKPIAFEQLRGKFVVLDFWTYCCINCIHILPELKKLEEAYPNNVVVIGVHSAKFETEKDTENIAEAILRYEIAHPVVNDRDHQFWNMLGVNSWPTLVLIDPEGKFVGAQAGEMTFEQLDEVIKKALPYYRTKKLLDETPLRFELLAYDAEPTPLRFPGKLLADEASGRLFISDSNHNRIVISSLDGQLLEIIGTGAIGADDGGYAECTFNRPQGIALHGETLYVADTENHMLRKIDLVNRVVTTIAGTGEQSRIPRAQWVGKPAVSGLNSPWDLWVHESNLYIAMAGPHQIWRMALDESEIGPYAGSGREDIIDGPRLSREPYGSDSSAFAQPSGLTSDGTWLYVADSEGSSIRAVPLNPNQPVRTVVGTADLPYGRLFEFGDVDGAPGKVRLQHCLGVAYLNGKIYVADTYNHKIKVVDAATGHTQTLAGNGKKGTSDNPPQFHEPSGLSIAAGKLYIADTNNHLIRTLDLASGQVSTLEIVGLEPPHRPEPPKPSFADAPRINRPAAVVRPENGAVRLKVELRLPQGWKINPDAPQQYWLEIAEPSTSSSQVLISETALGRQAVDTPSASFECVLPVEGEGLTKLQLSLIYHYCQIDGGLCKVGSVVWNVPLNVSPSGKTAEVPLSHEVPVGLPF